MSPNEKPKAFWSQPTAKSETYLGNCHCGTVCFKTTLSPPLYATATPADGQYDVIRCDCSICVRNGYLNVYPLKKDFEWLGDSQIHTKRYCTANKVCPHLFCENCGSSFGIDIGVLSERMGEESRICLNVRMFKDIELEKLKYKDVTRKDVGPKYESPV